MSVTRGCTKHNQECALCIPYRIHPVLACHSMSGCANVQKSPLTGVSHSTPPIRVVNFLNRAVRHIYIQWGIAIAMWKQIHRYRCMETGHWTLKHSCIKLHSCHEKLKSNNRTSYGCWPIYLSIQCFLDADSSLYFCLSSFNLCHNSVYVLQFWTALPEYGWVLHNLFDTILTIWTNLWM